MQKIKLFLNKWWFACLIAAQPVLDVLAFFTQNAVVTPAGIIRDLKLNRPIYSQLACYGHFGRTELELPWEEINRKYELLSTALKQSVRQ